MFSALWLLSLYSNEVLKKEKYKKYRKIFIINMIAVEISSVMVFIWKELVQSEEMLVVWILITFLLTIPYSILIESNKMLTTLLEAFCGSKKHLRRVILWVFIIFSVISLWISIVAFAMPSKSKVENIVKEHIRKIGYKVDKVKTDWWRQYFGKLITFNIWGESIIRFENEMIGGYYFVIRGGRKKEEIEIWIDEGEKKLRYRWEDDGGYKRASIAYWSYHLINEERVKECEAWEVDPNTGKKIKLIFKGEVK